MSRERDPIEVIDSGFRELNKRQDDQDAWISKIEAQQNTARHGRLSPGDNALNGIPADYRKHIDLAAKMGYDDPVKIAGMGFWWQMQILAKQAARNPTGTPPSEFIQMADRWEEANGFDPQEKHRLYAIQKGAVGEASGGGGSTIALPVEAELRRLIRDNAVMRRLATHVQMSSLTHQIPTENSNVTAFLVAEAGLVSDAMPSTSYAAVALTAKKIAGMATLSNEVMADNIVGLQQVIFTQIAEAIGIIEDQGAFNGVNFTGLSTVVGRFTTNASGQAVAGNNSGVIPVWPDVVTTIFKGLQRSSRVNGRWFMHPGVYKNLLSTLDSTGQPIVSFSNNYQTPPAGGIPFYIAGFPVEMSAVISTQDSTYTTSSSVFFADPSRVLYGDLYGLRFDLDLFGLFSTDQARLRVIERLAIQVPVGGFVSVLQGCRAV
jgi:HK97 family phage major capsid protein